MVDVDVADQHVVVLMVTASGRSARNSRARIVPTVLNHTMRQPPRMRARIVLFGQRSSGSALGVVEREPLDCGAERSEFAFEVARDAGHAGARADERHDLHDAGHAASSPRRAERWPSIAVRARAGRAPHAGGPRARGRRAARSPRAIAPSHWPSARRLPAERAVVLAQVALLRGVEVRVAASGVAARARADVQRARLRARQRDASRAGARGRPSRSPRRRGRSARRTRRPGRAPRRAAAAPSRSRSAGRARSRARPSASSQVRARRRERPLDARRPAAARRPAPGRRSRAPDRRAAPGAAPRCRRPR